MPYQWINLANAVAALAGRLADPGMVFWTYPELVFYLAESLRTWNALTEVWNADFVFSPSDTVWYDVSQLTKSPRQRTLTDTYLYTIMEYHLLEPASGGTWTGTTQFSISDLQGALQRRRDDIIQQSGCNMIQIPALASTPNSRRTYFPDTVLEPRRARFVPANTAINPNTMRLEDIYAFDGFEASYLQTTGTPQAWSVIAGPPLAMNVDQAPNQPGVYDVIALQSGPTFAPPAATLLGVPDDWAWVLKWGALSDLLGRESEATDRQRADYCLKRYMDGLKIMQQSNWLLQATIDGIPVDTPSMREQDGFSAEWEENPAAWPALVTAGIDFVAPCPVGVSSVSMILVGDAPVPVNPTDYVQCSRDTFDVVLDYAQVLAAFKMGGSEFASTKDLEKNFFTAAAATNKRLAKMGLFRDELGSEGKRQIEAQPR
jgi:hypothetical protein